MPIDWIGQDGAQIFTSMAILHYDSGDIEARIAASIHKLVKQIPDE